MRSTELRLRDVLSAIQQIEKYASRGEKAFLNDELVQDWILRRLQIIGEACAALPDDFRL